MNVLPNFDPAVAIAMISNPKTPWGKILSVELTTDRWADCPVPFWKTVIRWITGRGWYRQEFRLLTPRDADYDPTPYKRTTIL